ncbi:MAG: glycosyltransferase family 2 protein [Myxococcota bacterium]|nr:glycosyltransferase family 2 protein [Myxococcota bacterium]
MSGRACVVMPAFNEAERLPALLAALRRARPELDCIVVDDGSRDATAAVAAAAGARVLRLPFNLGYGAALQTGYKEALRRDAPWVVQMDADGQHLPAEVEALVGALASGDCDVVLGSRFLEASGYEMGAARSLGRDLFRAVARRAGLRVTDPTSGFQALSRRALEFYAGDWFPSDYPDVDVLLAATRAGLVVREVPVHMAPGARASTLHSGWKPLYYVYKMLLSIWAASGRPRVS